MADLLVVENPASRRGRTRAGLVRQYLESRGLARDVAWTEVSSLHECEPPRSRLIAVGGDGTVNAAASWLVETNVRCPLAIVAAGTGNNLARGLGVPLDPEPACDIALEGTRGIDLDVIRYRAGDGGEARILIQSGALGFPADIATLYDRLRHRRLFRLLAAPAGTYVYRLLALMGIARQRWNEWRGMPRLSVRVGLEKETIAADVLAVFIGNEKSLGGNFHPCPRARPDDGKLDICLVRAPTHEPYLKIFSRIAKGRHLDLVESIVYRQSDGKVELRLSMPVPLLADGDLWLTSDRFQLETCPGRVHVLTGM